MNDIFAPLPKEEVIAAIERRNPSRIPLIRTKWWGEGLVAQYGAALNVTKKYPEDAVFILVTPFDANKMNLSWQVEGGKAKDSGGIIPDWRYLDEFIEKLPDPEAPGLFDEHLERAAQFRKSGRYFMFGWWRLFFEMPWLLRGMENLLIDYYEYPEEVHRLHGALCELYVKLIHRAAKELQPDGFWTSDDLGHQTQLMMMPDQFRTFLKPYYQQVGEACKEHNMHFWLHSCGNNTDVLGDLIEVGVDVFHPVQKHTMDEQKVAEEFGDHMTFLAGIDVQQILQVCTPEQVRAEVRHLIDTFDRPEGGLCLAAGNGIVAGTPLENIEAFLDEAVRYGAQHRACWQKD
jgi:uroporphyrinogen decarboxylase